MIKYSLLPATEYAKLAEVFAANGGELPDPQLSIIAIAQNDQDEIVGFHALQYQIHAEPMWIAPAYRGKVNWREFQRVIEGILEPGGSYYIFPSDERVAKLCKRGGMEEIELRAWRRDIPEKIEES